MRRHVHGPLLAACVVGLTACSHDSDPVFNDLPSPSSISQLPAPLLTAPPSPAPAASGSVTGAAPAPSPAFSLPPESPPPRFDAGGSSSLQITGELRLRVTSDLDCTAAKDDYFVRGFFDLGGGYRLAVSINVEKYTGPGTYDKVVQVLIRRLKGTTYYASWYTGVASATVRPKSAGTDFPSVQLPPESGTASTRPITIAGHLACER
jgi:hypothetical protein